MLLNNFSSLKEPHIQPSLGAQVQVRLSWVYLLDFVSTLFCIEIEKVYILGLIRLYLQDRFSLSEYQFIRNPVESLYGKHGTAILTEFMYVCAY